MVGWLLALGEGVAVGETDGVVVDDAVCDRVSEELAATLAEEDFVTLVVALVVSDGDRLLLLEKEPVGLLECEAETLTEAVAVAVAVVDAVDDRVSEKLAVTLVVVEEDFVVLVVALIVSDGDRLLLLEKEPVALLECELELLTEAVAVAVAVVDAVDD